MRARPILMSGPMVRALLDGRKSQTRRIVKPQPEQSLDGEPYWHVGGYRLRSTATNPLVCPYGQPGDLLWVRETWALASRATDLSKVYYRAHENASHTEFHESVPTAKVGRHQPTWPRFKPSIHMPRWASRVTLELTHARVERLQDVSDLDAKAEGCFFTDYGRRCFHQGRGDAATCPAPGEHHPQREGWMWATTSSHEQCLGSARAAYGNLWGAINGPGSWDGNPWVWVLSFRVHRQNIDEVLKARAA